MELRTYNLIKSRNQLPELLARLRRASYVALDTETSGLNIHQDDFNLAGIAVAPNPYEGYYIPVGHLNFGGINYQPDNLPSEDVANFLREVFKHCRVVMHNASYDRQVLYRSLGLSLAETYSDDTMVALHLKDENHQLSLKAWAKTLLNVDERNPQLPANFEDELQEKLLRWEYVNALTPSGRKSRRKVWSLVPNWQDIVYDLWGDYHNGAVSFNFVLNFTAKLFGLLRLRGLAEYSGTFPSDFRYVPVIYGAEYALDDVMNTHALWAEVEAFFMQHPELKALYSDIELPVNDIMARASVRGVLVDTQHLKQVKSLLEARIEEVREKAMEAAAQILPMEMVLSGAVKLDTFLSSPRQLSKLIYEILGFPVIELTDSGAPSTARQVLELLVHTRPSKRPEVTKEAREFIRLKLRYEALRKLHSTYTDSILSKLDSQQRLHTQYNTVGTVSGRMSSNNPNFQNMPRLLPEEVADKPWLHGIDIRRAFVADPGHVFISADYASMELVVCAALSGDETMTRLLNEGRDLHSYTARYAFKVGMDLDDAEFKKRYKDYRQKAKIVNFALIYGGTAYTLIRNFGFQEQEAVQLIQGYFEAYPQVKTWMERVYKELETKGYVVYPEYNYIKRMDAVKPRDAWNKEAMRQFKAALRTCQNALIQGYSAFLVKDAIVKMTKRFNEENLDAQVIFQVHDEIGVLARAECAKKAAQIMLECMERDINGVRLQAEPEFKLTMSKTEAPMPPELVDSLVEGL
jgi:DNA polymerase I-like protein with 3'-5' exonuclease and polymerase domains